MKDVFLSLLWIVFVTDSILLVLIVLIQSGRGGGLSGMLGGGGMAESALGPKTGLPRITGIMATVFFGCAILIGGLTRERAVVDPNKPKEESAKKEGAATPAPKTATGAKEGEPKAKTATAVTPKASTAVTPKAATSTETKAGTSKPTTAAPAKATTGTAPTPKAAPSTPTTPGKTP